MNVWFLREDLPEKDNKYGIKLFKICSLNKYTWKIQINCGRTDGYGIVLGEKVTMNLCEELLPETIISIPLTKNLLKRQIYLIKKILLVYRNYRIRLPKELLKCKLEIKLDGIGFNEWIVFKWKPKQNKVLMLLTFYNLQMSTVPAKCYKGKCEIY